MNSLALQLILALFWNVQQVPVLAPCPDSPNCVNSYQSDEEHTPMEPLRYSGDYDKAMAVLKDVIREMPRTDITDSSNVYLKVVFTIALFGFEDDVEFLADTLRNEIHFRSASRVGYYDLGVNRRRMESIREAWMEIAGDGQ
ncbi:DUF1499 domain-containing protein [Fulvivirga sedimenti]|uniref:DUF1499 domain-containing protein n=1 Tax=Fulvivirga sedimenti TaxID=2879465 RepID=A0A9X1HRC0_9BACT|nr:DUF1499 domain-containing protein [Fulvivirga sedimenti]MCA6074579.1 DUF1499 domain-containing protein [Fulvivirga sedimenti]MCA6075756.1 DUF1499 domain-containing protein [Fulvivirga sedimenti]MCA6076884.1 DUF1499 domain-containing protein [Fulvivirga sedimenti]